MWTPESWLKSTHCAGADVDNAPARNKWSTNLVSSNTQSPAAGAATTTTTSESAGARSTIAIAARSSTATLASATTPCRTTAQQTKFDKKARKVCGKLQAEISTSCCPCAAGEMAAVCPLAVCNVYILTRTMVLEAGMWLGMALTNRSGRAFMTSKKTSKPSRTMWFGFGSSNKRGRKEKS